MRVFRQFLKRIRMTGAKRAETVVTMSMGQERKFDAFDIGPDTFILERGVSGHLDEHPSVLIV